MAKILIIDDEESTRIMLRRLLEREGHTVFAAEDGKAGLRMFQETGCDLVVTDILMPEKDGLELILTLRNQNPAVKIVAMSGGGKTGALDFLSLAKTFGAVATLSKPIEKEALRNAVNEALQA